MLLFRGSSGLLGVWLAFYQMPNARLSASRGGGRGSLRTPKGLQDHADSNDTQCNERNSGSVGWLTAMNVSALHANDTTAPVAGPDHADEASPGSDLNGAHRQRSSAMRRPRCPRCTGYLYYNAEDELPRFTCLACGRSFVPSRDAA
jgi:hypothetical protein